MTVKKIYKIGSDMLREKSKEIDNFKDGSLKNIANDLKDTLFEFQKSHDLGRAIAAPQIGYLKKVIYYNKNKEEILMVNPEIIEKSKEEFEVWDSCFSFDAAFFVKINRAKKIKVRYQDIEGKYITKEFEDDLSELFQHEIDHLYGVLATDHLKDNKNIILREVWEENYR